MALSPEARDLVIRTLIGEGAANDTDSWISVAHVLKNRADSGHYGDPFSGGLTSTIKAPKQFSMWNADISSSGKTISPNDPRYQRAGAIADAVFSGQIPDNTGGADHYYAPSGMPGGRAPSWAVGQPRTASIGGQHFYKLGLGASDAVNHGHTSAGPIEQNQQQQSARPLDGLGAAKVEGRQAVNAALAAAKGMLGKNEVPDHDEIMKYLHDGGQDLDPHKLAWCASFVSASLQRAGLPVPTQVAQGSLQGGGANARNYLTYGTGVSDPNGVQAGDILVAKNGSHVGFAEGPIRQGPNGPEVQLIAGNEGDRSGRYTPGSYTNPQTGAVANRQQVGMVGERWVPLSDYAVRRPGEAAPTAVASAGGLVANPDVPAPQAQPAAASTPSTPSQGFQLPGGGQSQPAGFTGPGSDKYSVVQGMTTGTGRNPQLTTAANWGNLFGGDTPAPPAAAPAPAPSPAAPASTASTIDTSYGPQAPKGGFYGPPMPAPPPQQTQTSSMQPNLFASAQNLLKGLFG